jgi:hypothetical protein
LNSRVLIVASVLIIGVLAYFAWKRTSQDASTAQPPAPAQEAPAPSMGMMPPAGAPGVEWNTPGRWSAEAASGVRLATYTIPAQGGAQAAQCAVFYFGQGQGGGVEPNIERWIGEFQDPPPADRSTIEVNGMQVHRVEVRGNYVAHAMGTGEGAAAMDDAMLLGAIVEGPNGAVFFKMTGPSATVSAAEAEFDAMLQSLRAS